METAEFFRDFADPDIRARMKPLPIGAVRPGETSFIDELRVRHRDPEYRARDEAELMTRKNWQATGSFLKDDRPRALDLLGFASQLVFNTFANKALVDVEHGPDLDLAYGLARAHNRAMVEFCAVDPPVVTTMLATVAERKPAALAVALGYVPASSPANE
jgi:hypothetical protein